MRAKYNQLSIEKVAKNYYDQGEKCGKLLAWWLKKNQLDRAINSIKTPAGDMTSEPVEINNIFRDFYEALYTSERSDDLHCQNSFLDQLRFQTLSENEQKEFNSIQFYLYSVKLQQMSSQGT